jgi:acyl-coenzyme A thioesterase PaaI-like protein
VSAAAPVDQPLDDGHCFGCGPLSDIGLKMRFDERPDGTVECRFSLGEAYQGWRGVAHGGIVALVLDEAMAYAAATRGLLGVTAELKMRFRKPVPLGVAASVSNEAGVLLASGDGSFVAKGKLAPGQRLGRLDGDR